jgi:tRNA(fMet)-specific endonuclease VapC
MKTSTKEIKYCLESSFIIDLLSAKTNAIQVYEKIKNAPLTIASIASVVFFEIIRGREQKPEKIQMFEQFKRKLTILPFGEREAEEANKIERAIRKKGQSITPLDLLIGATAKANDAILVTNDKGYNKIRGLKVQNY